MIIDFVFLNFYRTLLSLNNGFFSKGSSFCSTAQVQITQKIGFIGDGSMAKAICRGIKRKGKNYLEIFLTFIQRHFRFDSILAGLCLKSIHKKFE